MPTPTAFFTTDTDLALLSIEGEDATRFLNAQLMTALEDRAGFAACPAALADAKGRVLATFQLWRNAAGWRLAIPVDEAAWLQNHLARFVFRSQVHSARLGDASLLGVFGPDAKAALVDANLPAPEPGCAALAGKLGIIGLAGNRWLLTGTKSELEPIIKILATQTKEATIADWIRARLVAGEAEVRAATRERYIPQMLGLDALGVVSFHKGCYPGQEVIARTRYRGRIKRALTLLQLEKPLEAGTRHDIEGARIEVLDSVAFANAHAPALVQAIAPTPLPPALATRVYAASSNAA